MSNDVIIFLWFSNSKGFVFLLLTHNYDQHILTLIWKSWSDLYWKHWNIWPVSFFFGQIYACCFLLHNCCTSIFYWLSILEEFDGGVATDFKFLCKFLLFSGINFSEFDFRSFISKSLSCLFIFRSKGFAVSTPWCIYKFG